MLPTWQPNHAYLVTTRVTKTVDDGTVWSVQTAGTSAGVEPTWPVAEPWTVTDGTVTWGKATSFRQNAVAGLVATLATFAAGNPTLLASYSAARPKSLSNMSLPGAYVGSRDETIVHPHDLRIRTLTGLTVVVVDKIPDNVQAQNRMDLLMDGLVDVFTASYASAGGYSIIVESGVSEVSIEENGVAYLANVIAFSPSQITEGRE